MPGMQLGHGERHKNVTLTGVCCCLWGNSGSEAAERQPVWLAVVRALYSLQLVLGLSWSLSYSSCCVREPQLWQLWEEQLPEQRLSHSSCCVRELQLWQLWEEQFLEQQSLWNSSSCLQIVLWMSGQKPT